MKLPAAPWLDRDGLDQLLDALGAREGLTRIVGGAVRDTLLGLDVADIDCATTLAPEEVRDRVVAAGFKAVPTGMAHGTITAVVPGKSRFSHTMVNSSPGITRDGTSALTFTLLPPPIT